MRRWLFFVWLALLLVPAAGLIGPFETAAPREARLLAQAPAFPTTLQQALALPRDIDAFVRDQFGFRDEMMRGNARIRGSLDDKPTATSPVINGRDNFLLFREGLLLSMGAETSPERVARTSALYCEMRQRLARQNIRFIFAIPPSPTTIYPEAAPEWLSPRPRTDYDALIEAVRACGAEAVDLRLPLRAQRKAHMLYRRTDTHWTPRGAMIAYNTVMRALGLDEMRLPLRELHWSRARRPGDLVRMSGAVEDRLEVVEEPDLAAITTLQPTELHLDPTGADPDRYIRDYPREGLSVLVIGDSFTALYFPDFLAPFARRVSFVHHRQCNFDWGDVARAAPDVVILAPTERNAACPVEHGPAHFDD